METEIFYKNLGQEIKCLRKKRKLTQEQLGHHIGCTKSAIVNYETGIRKIPFDVLVKLSDFYKVSIDYLIKKQKTLADILDSEIGDIKLTEQQEQLLIKYIHVLLGKEK